MLCEYKPDLILKTSFTNEQIALIEADHLDYIASDKLRKFVAFLNKKYKWFTGFSATDVAPIINKMHREFEAAKIAEVIPEELIKYKVKVEALKALEVKEIK